MLQIVQLQDGCYKVILDYSVEGVFTVHREWTFAEAESDAEPLENGENIRVELK